MVESRVSIRVSIRVVKEPARQVSKINYSAFIDNPAVMRLFKNIQ